MTGVRATGILVMLSKNDGIVNERVEKCLLRVICLGLSDKNFGNKSGF